MNWNKTIHDFGNIVGGKEYKTEFIYSGDVAVRSIVAECDSCTIIKITNKDPYTIEATYTPRVLSRAELRQNNMSYDSLKNITITYVDNSHIELQLKSKVFDKELPGISGETFTVEINDTIIKK